jgi:hypothetical protein
MNPMIAIALITAIQALVKTYFDLSGKTTLTITKEDLDTKSPDEILAGLGVVLDAQVK